MFKKMSQPRFPPRHWSLVGHPGTGKSTFAARMRGPSLVIDADHRFSEVLDLAQGDVYQLSPTASDNVDPDRIYTVLLANMPGSGVQTIIVDSLTAIITPYVVQAMIDKEKGRLRNMMAGFQKKAVAMRQLQDAVTRWGTDTLWIYHLQDSRDANANAVIRSTVSQTEIARLTRSINLQLEVVTDGARRGIKVAWARRGRAGMILWDEAGSWQGMPELIEATVYQDLTPKQQAELSRATPRSFPNDQTAISWGKEQGAFATIEEARRAYTALKAEGQTQNARELANIWVTEIRIRTA
jgi:hypothetical protein